MSSRTKKYPRPKPVAGMGVELDPCGSHGSRGLFRRFGELGIGLQATLADIYALIFFFFRDANPDDCAQGEPDHEAGAEYPGKDCGYANQLAHQ